MSKEKFYIIQLEKDIQRLTSENIVYKNVLLYEILFVSTIAIIIFLLK